MKNFNKKTKREIGVRFKAARNAIKKTQKELALMLNMDTSSIASIEGGKAFPNIPIMIFLLENFNINPVWLMTGSGSMITQDNKAEENESFFKKFIPGIKNTHLPIALEIINKMKDPFVLLRLSSYIEIIELERNKLLGNIDVLKPKVKQSPKNF